jgi:hypothetical protein
VAGRLRSKSDLLIYCSPDASVRSRENDGVQLQQQHCVFYSTLLLSLRAVDLIPCYCYEREWSVADLTCRGVDGNRQRRGRRCLPGERRCYPSRRTAWHGRRGGTRGCAGGRTRGLPPSYSAPSRMAAARSARTIAVGARGARFHRAGGPSRGILHARRSPAPERSGCSPDAGVAAWRGVVRTSARRPCRIRPVSDEGDTAGVPFACRAKSVARARAYVTTHDAIGLGVWCIGRRQGAVTSHRPGVGGRNGGSRPSFSRPAGDLPLHR